MVANLNPDPDNNSTDGSQPSACIFMTLVLTRRAPSECQRSMSVAS